MLRANLRLCTFILLLALIATSHGTAPRSAEAVTVDGPEFVPRALAMAAPALPEVEHVSDELPLPRPYCPSDLVVDDNVNVSDLLELLSNWGRENETLEGPGNIDYWLAVDVRDLLILLGQWGPCPTYDEDLMATLTMVRTQISLFRTEQPELFGTWDPRNDGWDLMIELDYLQEPPVNPIFGISNVRSAPGITVGWVWRDPDGAGPANELELFGVSVLWVEYVEDWLPNWNLNWFRIW